MTSTYRPGTSLQVTATGQRVVVWSPAPDPGTYWAHLMPEERVVLISVRHQGNAPLPVVKVKEYR